MEQKTINNYKTPECDVTRVPAVQVLNVSLNGLQDDNETIIWEEE